MLDSCLFFCSLSTVWVLRITEAVRFEGKCLYPLSHRASLTPTLFLEELSANLQ